MRISAEHNKRLKKITMIALCAVIAVCLLIKPVQHTIAYITATSVTCTNTFSNGTPTEVEDTMAGAALESDAPRKVFRDGQVYILREGKTYTLTGEEVL